MCVCIDLCVSVCVCVCDCRHETSGDGSVNFQGVVPPVCAILRAATRVTIFNFTFQNLSVST